MFLLTLAAVFSVGGGGGFDAAAHEIEPWLLVALAAFALVVWQFLPAQYTDRIGTLGGLVGAGSDTAVATEVSFRGRLSETTVAWQMFLDHPIQGVGLANYNSNYQAYSQNLGLDPAWMRVPPTASIWKLPLSLV